MTDYSCGAAFCDDPACIIHGAKDADGELKWRLRMETQKPAGHSGRHQYIAMHYCGTRYRVYAVKFMAAGMVVLVAKTRHD